MPRKARIDAPGALHHIMSRGIERRKIFLDDTDRNSFIERFGRLVSETKTVCYAWALLPNHFHLMLRTGNVRLAPDIAKRLRISQSAVVRAVARGERIAADMDLKLIEE